LKLDPIERYVIAYYRLPVRAISIWRAWLIARCLITCFFAYGLCNANQPLVFAAFGTLLLLDLYSQAKQPQYIRALHSVLAKLEQRIEELEKTQSTPSRSTADGPLESQSSNANNSSISQT
jgi:hypothetical protein